MDSQKEIKDESRRNLIEEPFMKQLFAGRVKGLEDLCDWKPASIGQDPDENTVRDVLDNMNSTERAETLVQYIQYFESSEHSHIWRWYIENFRPNLWECNFVEMGYFVNIAHETPLVYTTSDLTTDYCHVCENGGRYEWRFKGLSTLGTGNSDGAENKNLGHAMVIDTREFDKGMYNRPEDRDKNLEGIKDCLCMAGYTLYLNEDAKTDETIKPYWLREILINQVDAFLKYCGKCKPNKIMLILMSCGDGRDSILTSDIEGVTIGDITKRLNNDCEVGKQLKDSLKNIIFYGDITVKVPQPKPSNSGQHCSKDNFGTQSHQADSERLGEPYNREKQNCLETLSSVLSIRSCFRSSCRSVRSCLSPLCYCFHFLYYCLSALPCCTLPVCLQRGVGVREAPISPDIQIVFENRKQPEQLRFGSESLFLHCLVFVFRQLY